MDNNFVNQKEEQNNILQVEKMSLLENIPVEGSGSESQLQSLHSQKNDITGSSSSINPVGPSNDCINYSNGNNNKVSNEKSNSMNDINTINNNPNTKNLPISKVSDIEKKDQSTSKTEISGLLKDMNGNSDKNKSSSIDMISDDFSSTTTNINNNIEDLYSTVDLISGNYSQEDINMKDNSNDKSDINQKKELKKEAKKKIKEGFIPFFIQAEGLKPKYYYAKPNAQVKLGIDHYFKKINDYPIDKYLFYYNDNLIDIEKTFKDVNLKKFGTIFAKLK